jgi:hypothetical protein
LQECVRQYLLPGAVLSLMPIIMHFFVNKSAYFMRVQ